MKEIVNFFTGRRYSAVHTAENFHANELGTAKSHKSLQTKPRFQGLPVLDVFFHDRKHGDRARWPKCKLFDFFLIKKWEWISGETISVCKYDAKL